MTAKIRLLPILVAVMMIFGMIPTASATVRAEDIPETALSGDVLNGCKVRIRPAGSHQPLSINKDGSESQNCVHLFVQGKSSQFYLEKKDEDSYLIYFYTHYRDAAHNTSGDCRLDIDNGGEESGYYKEGQVIHVVSDNADAMNKRWQFIPNEDGTYYIRNKLSGQYWSLDDLSNINANTNKLVQRKTPMKWVIEIVDGNNEKLKSVNDYDSRNFTYNGQTVKSTNWMGALPGSLKITDISIPGTHDSGACNLHTSQDTMSTQRYYIDELLNCGVRHLDVRTGLDDNNNVRIVHSTCHARNHSDQELKLSEVMGWIDDFLESNPTETVIFQIKVDSEGDACERETFRQLEAMAKVTNSRIWAGDHVPTLDEARGHILIISRLNPDKLQGGNFDIVKDGKTLKWALDCHDWKDSYDQASALTAQGTNYEVWTQDNWNRSFSNKKSYVRATLFGKIDGYTNGTMYRYDRAKQVGKDAWVFNYTSANNGSTENPYAIAKDMHQWIYDSSDYSKSDRLVCKDTFTGVMAFDYMDGLMATKIYKTNFNRQYITIHGVTADGEEPVDPLTLFVGDESESITKLTSDTTRQIITAHFNTDPYLVMSAENGEILSASKASDSEGFESGVRAFESAVSQGNAGNDLYVHLEAPVREAEYEVELPVCRTEVSAEDPGVTVVVDDGKPYETAADASGNRKAFITENADSETAFSGTVEGGTAMPVLLYLEPKWGFRFSDHCTVTSDNTVVRESGVLKNGQLKVKATGNILHSADRVEEVPASCESSGVKEHYYCDNCKRKFLSMTEMGDQSQVEVSDEELFIPACGHEWGEWTVTKEATGTAAGEKQRVCRHDTSHVEKQIIPAKGSAPGSDADQKGADGTEAGAGASAANAEQAILNASGDEGPSGTIYAPLQLRSTKQTRKSVTLKWNAPAGVVKYVIYGNLCGKGNGFKRITEVSGKKSLKVTKSADKKLKKGKYYKFIIVALDSSDKVISTSKVVHVATKGGKAGNHRKVTVKKSVVTKAKKLKAGKSLKLKARAVRAKLKVKKHRAVAYESSDPAVATVSRKGVVKGVSKGSCYIYAYAQNGVYKRVRITVK